MEPQSSPYTGFAQARLLLRIRSLYWFVSSITVFHLLAVSDSPCDAVYLLFRLHHLAWFSHSMWWTLPWPFVPLWSPRLPIWKKYKISCEWTKPAAVIFFLFQCDQNIVWYIIAVTRLFKQISFIFQVIMIDVNYLTSDVLQKARTK